MKIIDQTHLKNKSQDLKISSTLCDFLKLGSIFFGIVILLSITFVSLSFAEVFIPSHEYLGYFDSNGIYTIVGNVKNENTYAVIPTITVGVIDEKKIYSKIIKHVPIGVDKEIPFKIKFPEVTSKSPVLLAPEILIEKTNKEIVSIEVLYDQTLIKHEDGHITGRIQNTGDEVIHFPKIFAVVHGYEDVLDIVQNIEFFEKIEPGEILKFSMYPDPSITEDIFYYSCFAPVDTTVIPITTKKNGEDFDFRYDSGAWYYNAKFDEKGTTLSISGYNSYPLETYANFEFPPISGNEEFDVTLDDKSINFIQSIDDMGFWHVAFSVKPTSQGVLKISGFEKGLPPEMPKIPQWIKVNADWWATNKISDSEFLEGIDFLLEKGIIVVPSKELTAQSNWSIPSWYKIIAAWWFEDKISDDELLYSIENLVAREIIII